MIKNICMFELFVNLVFILFCWDSYDEGNIGKLIHLVLMNELLICFKTKNEILILGCPYSVGKYCSDTWCRLVLPLLFY
jgi:hypothetical protein